MIQPELSAIEGKLISAFHADDSKTLRLLLDENPALKKRIGEPIGGCFDSPPVTLVKSRAMLDVLLDAGADINAKSRWWAGGFGILHTATPEIARYAIERGAEVDVHAAARLGMIDRLREQLASYPQLAHAGGGDGQTPLHFAANVEVAAILLEAGAEIDARDVDHCSTPAQHMVKNRQEVARFLIQQGCKTDILMAAALGDVALAQRILDSNPQAIRMRVSDAWFPMTDERSGGSIYQWELGWHVSPHQVARAFGHTAVYDLLMKRSPAEVKLVNAAWLGDRGIVRSLLASNPDLVEKFTDEDRKQLVNAARNNNTEAAMVMLEAGLPTDSRGQHNATALHWAAWHGNAALTNVLLRYPHEIHDRTNEFNSDPIGWAIHGSQNGWHRATGDYRAVVKALLAAGAKMPKNADGSEAGQALLG